MSRSFKRIITLTAIILIILFFCVRDRLVYNKVYDLITIEEINISSRHIGQAEGTNIYIDASENATYIAVNGVGYVVDNEKLFGILSKYKCKRTRNHYFPYQSNDVVVEISIVQNYRPKHILLGEFNVWYESADKEAFDIIDGNKLLNEITSLIEKEQ